MSASARSRMPPQPLLSSIAGWRTTTPCIPIPGWAIAHPGSTSFPNPLRVRFDGVNSRRAVMAFYSKYDRVYRRFVPSMAKASYNPLVKIGVDAVSSALSLPFPELRDLPPNHLRIRIGAGNRILNDHLPFIETSSRCWLTFLSRQYCTFRSDVVELGCGCGRVARSLKDDWFEGTYLGVDIDSEMLEYCQRNFP